MNSKWIYGFTQDILPSTLGILSGRKMDLNKFSSSKYVANYKNWGVNLLQRFFFFFFKYLLIKVILTFTYKIEIKKERKKKKNKNKKKTTHTRTHTHTYI